MFLERPLQLTCALAYSALPRLNRIAAIVCRTGFRSSLSHYPQACTVLGICGAHEVDQTTTKERIALQNPRFETHRAKPLMSGVVLSQPVEQPD